MEQNRSELRQRADYTYKANRKTGRHGWLRLTPAYSLKLVREKLLDLPRGSNIIEPFSGSGTTPLAAQELGLPCQAREINPFLVWLGNAKLDNYSDADLSLLHQAESDIENFALDNINQRFWIPDLFNIERWWGHTTLNALSAIKTQINEYDGKVRNLLDIAFCRTIISTSNASFNHQSMSFKGTSKVAEPEDTYVSTLNAFLGEIDFVSATIDEPMPHISRVIQGDSSETFDDFTPADFVITSPPYANRMSYIRELRPYMYWLGFLSSGAEAGELDWKTTGGTWGTASTKVKTWTPEEETPIEDKIEEICSKIAEGKSGDVLAPYVSKYFHDMWRHFRAIAPSIKSGGQVCYIVGNSTFSGHNVPTQEWYMDMLRELGFSDVHADIIRKRNSNKMLFEYAVCATRQ